jgi:hypothetical protein
MNRKISSQNFVPGAKSEKPEAMNPDTETANGGTVAPDT